MKYTNLLLVIMFVAGMNLHASSSKPEVISNRTGGMPTGSYTGRHGHHHMHAKVSIAHNLDKMKRASTFKSELKKAGLYDMLRNNTSQYIVLVPVNRAFERHATDWDKLSSSQKQEILKNHIVMSDSRLRRLADGSTLTALSGKTLTITRKPREERSSSQSSSRPRLARHIARHTHDKGYDVYVNNVRVSRGIPSTNGYLYLMGDLLMDHA